MKTLRVVLACVALVVLVLLARQFPYRGKVIESGQHLSKDSMIYRAAHGEQVQIGPHQK